MDLTLKSPRDWFAAGRIMARAKMPYFSVALLSLIPYEVPGFGTLGVTERGVLLWDPELQKKWSVEELAWVLLHEVGHYVRDHSGRQKITGAEQTLWNIAGDAEINDDLLEAKAKFPHLDEPDENGNRVVSGVTPGKIGCQDGRMCEEYYDHLRKNAKVIKVGMISMPGSGKGKGKGKGKGTGDEEAPGNLTAQLGGKGCGSGSGAKPDPAEADIPTNIGSSSADKKRVQRAVAEAIRSQAEKGRGNVPQGLQRWAEETLGPSRVPWRQLLASACRMAIAYRPGAGDYRYDRPSRRQGAYGYGTGSPVFPALRRPVPCVAIITDTSGSMGDGELRVALEESKGILAAIGSQVTFMTCDAQVHGVKKVHSINDVAKALVGGGGTDFHPAFAAVEKLKPRPELVVFITDGDGACPSTPPFGMKVIWLLVGSYRRTPATWGTVIELETEKDAAA